LEMKDPFDFGNEVLENGTEIFYQKTERDETEVRLLLKAGGARYDPPAKEGCGHMLEHLIAKKTHSFPDELARDYFALEHDLEWEAFTNFESIYLKGDSSTAEISSLLFFLGEFLKRSQLTEELLEKEKEIVIREMGDEQKVKELSDVVLETRRALFGDHPFSRLIYAGGTLWTVNSLNIDDIIEHRRKFFLASNLTVIAISSLDLEKLKTEIQKYLALPRGKDRISKASKGLS
jgi:predicted Zn-dependent peptidase